MGKRERGNSNGGKGTGKGNGGAVPFPIPLPIPAAVVALFLFPASLFAQSGTSWPQHSMDRPQPPIVTPAPAGAPVPAPSDAIVLFDGTSLATWRSAANAANPAQWKIENGYMEVAGRTGDIATAQGFGDAQLHVEFMTPASPAPTLTGQGRGNSGVYLMSKYELQVLDSYDNKTYPDGQAGAIYGQFPPLVNASRRPGEWQTYDIMFHAPRFDASGAVTSPARMTVLHNGVLVQNDVALRGPTAHTVQPPYEAHPNRLPLLLQNHGDPVRYRNIWIRELP